jgi:hypothetical protein
LKRAAGINKKFFLKEKMTMKTTRKLIPAIAMLLVSAVMLTTASYAWFTMGNQANATGMSVQAEAASSMLIVDATGKTANDLPQAFMDAKNSIKFDSISHILKPATAYDAATMDLATGVTEASLTSGLVTLADPTQANNKTGVAADDVTYVHAAQNTNYYDYVAYIAAGGNEMNQTTTPNATLKATVTLPDGMMTGDALTTYIHNAFTIRFEIKDSTETTEPRVITKNLKEVVTANGELTFDLGTTTIPTALEADADGAYTTVNDYVTVTMRVYYDGALVDGQNGTYIRNERTSNTPAAFNVKFDYAK